MHTYNLIFKLNLCISLLISLTFFEYLPNVTTAPIKQCRLHLSKAVTYK